MKHRLIPSQYDTNQSTYNQSAWSLASHARLEVVEEEDEDDRVQPDHIDNVPNLKVTSHGPSEMEYELGDVAGVESSGPAERAIGQDTENLDIVALRDSESDTPPRSISKPNFPPTPKFEKPVIHDKLDSPTSSMLFGPCVLPPTYSSSIVTQQGQQPRPNPTQQVLPGHETPSTQLLDCALPTKSQPLNLRTDTSHVAIWSPTIAVQTLPTAAVGSEPAQVQFL